MAKYGLFTEDGMPIAFFDTDVNPQIPENAIRLSDEEWREFILNPGKRRWDFELSQVVLFNPEDLLSFSERQSRLKRIVSASRRRRENLGITIHTLQGDYIVDTSQIGRSNLQGTILTYEIGNLDKTSDTVPWKFENGFLELNYDQLKEISAFVTDYIEKLFLAEKQHYDAIEQLTTIEEIQNYDLDQFWPSNEYNASF